MDIVCFSAVNWDPIMTRIQHLMKRFPKGNRVFFFEPPSTLISPLKDRERLEDLYIWIKNPKKKLDNNIYILKLPPVFPFYNKNRIVNRINSFFLAVYLNIIFKRFNVQKPLFWMYLPNNVDLLKYVKYSYLVYDCVDKHSEFSGLINKELVEQYERELCEKSNVVFATAETLYESVKSYNPNTYLIPNGADFDLFNSAYTQNLEKPEEFLNIKGRVLGYVGVIRDWVDIDLIDYIASRREDWSIVLIGPVGNDVDITRLRSKQNVHFLGARKQQELPRYIKYFDVCLNVFKVNELTKNVSPLKLYEYMATGKPIVSTRMPHVQNYTDVVYIADDYEDFIKKCEIAMGEDKSVVEKRIECAKQASWDNRMKDIMAIIEKEFALGR
ncbi:glycosyltransferase [Caldanaerobius polysaccharolyticus]|uniref:glycosyltransferase n=1 Tax=Caldanaerobius polysaccharolyticus TaxID=44256 RepID=UPI00047A1315|nr:glycosyltransferase [Caldanaerobius polysaccharolyticus]